MTQDGNYEIHPVLGKAKLTPAEAEAQCDHNHTGVAKYNALLDGYGPIVFGGDPNHEFTRSLTFWWGEKDPNLQKWIGR